MKDILDYEEPVEITREKRPLAILLEGIPVLLIIIFLLLNMRQAFFYVTFSLSLIYIFAGWYLFRTNKHKWYNMLIATISGILLASTLMGPIFQVMSWEGQRELLIAGTLVIIYATVLSFVVAIIRTLISKNKKMELGMSWKIFFRFLILFFIYVFADYTDDFVDLVRQAQTE